MGSSSNRNKAALQHDYSYQKYWLNVFSGWPVRDILCGLEVTGDNSTRVFVIVAILVVVLAAVAGAAMVRGLRIRVFAGG